MFADFIHLQQYGIFIFLSVLSFIALYNLRTIKRLGSSPPQGDTPLVSILVPARNEARNIEDCLLSLLDQDYASYELIALDDESQDNTAEILSRLSQEYPRLRVMPGQPLPSGWMGKPWACHQLSQAARGELLLFVDADTRHQPRMLSQAVASAVYLQADLLSGLPRQVMKTWAERLILPMLAWAILSFFPFRLFQRLPFSFLAIAVGQFILIRRTAYLQIGGHAAVRSSVIEDIALARRAKTKGLKCEFVNLAGYVETRMYANFRQVIDGLSKNLFAVFGYNLPVFLFIWVWLAIALLHPVLSLFLYLAGIQYPGYAPALALACVTLSLLPWLASAWFFGLPPAQAMAYPLTMALSGLIVVRTIWLHYTRSSILWKGRRIDPRGVSTG